MQRARSKTDKFKRERSILTAAEGLLREHGCAKTTMQAIAASTGIAKGTLYLYFTSRESIVIKVYDQLFDCWVERFASHQPQLSGFDEFCRRFAMHYAEDPLFLHLSGFVNALFVSQLDSLTYIKNKRSMSRRIKRLAGLACRQFSITPQTAQKLTWGLLTIAGGAAQMAVRPPVVRSDLPEDIITFTGLENFELVFLNAAAPLGADLTLR